MVWVKTNYKQSWASTKKEPRVYLNNITHDTLSKEILSLYAIIYSDTSHYNKHFDILMSKKYFEKIIKLYPNDMQNYYNYAKFFQDISDYQSALNYYDKAVQIDPNNKYLYYNMGFCSLQMQDYPLAINYFSNSISLDNSFLLAYHARAYLFELSDNEKKAEIDWKNCLLLDPSYLPAIEGLSK